MPDNAYWPGQLVRVKTTSVFAVNGVATDPTEVTVLVKNPAGTVTTYTFGGGTVSRAAAGDYYVDLTIPTTAAAEGRWCYAFRGTGVVIAADEGRFVVRRSTVR